MVPKNERAWLSLGLLLFPSGAIPADGDAEEGVPLSLSDEEEADFRDAQTCHFFQKSGCLI